MNPQQLLARQIERGQEGFLNMIAKVPEDKLDWSPGDNMRSALDQFQEVATILDFSWSVYSMRKLEWIPESFDAYLAERKRFATRESCETELRRNSQRLIEFALSRSTEELLAPVDMPWPGEFLMCDCIQYHVWNMAYHEGQIAAIIQRLGLDPMA